MKIVALKETRPGETRVALVPETCKKLIKAGYTVAWPTKSDLGKTDFNFTVRDDRMKADWHC